MTTTINASTSAGLVQTADTSGALALQTASTTALSISASQVVTLTNALPVASGGSGVTTSTGTGSVVLGTSPTLTSPTISGAVVSSMASSVITSGTAVASTSGTSIDFTSIPSWVKRITVMLQGVSTNGSSVPIMRLGTSGGFVTSGYASGGIYTGTSTGSGNRTDSLLISGNAFDATATLQGHSILTNITGNSWVQSFTIGQSNSAYALMGGGSITLAGALTQIRITTVNGTDAFDAGSINILYE
jgi:hypothetical protein